MTTYFTFWHWIAISSFGLVFLFFVFISFKEENRKNILSMIFSSFLVIVTAGAFSIMAIDKYTKKATLYGVKNTRILRKESIVFTGFVKNQGNHTIGKIVLTVKLVNKGHVTGNVKAGSFYKPSGIFDFALSFGGKSKINKPQKIERSYTVAVKIRPGSSKRFRVEMPFPPHFKHVSEFTSITAH
ncbi:MAG TPA: DUF2393 domain-containing protein [Sulfurimonas sp.]|nr:DUF2393 domain-containing protein [Sulfurimonas sp.]